MPRAVIFDIGETLVDETRYWESWATWLGVPRLTFMAALGAVIAERRDHREVFDCLRGDDSREHAVDAAVAKFDLSAAMRARAADPDDLFHGPAATWPEARDLYPDVLSCLRRLEDDGCVVGVAGNQPARVVPALRSAGIQVDMVATSEGWGVQKPQPAFFERVVRECGFPASTIAYVGDRVDHDVVPALSAGMVSVHLRRGPWGVIQRRWPEARRAHLLIEALDVLPACLEDLWRGTASTEDNTGAG